MSKYYIFQGPMKRSHSPSPPPPATSYHVNYNYKPPPTITYSQPQISNQIYKMIFIS